MLKINKIRIEQNMGPNEGDAVSYSLQESKQKYFDSEKVVEGITSVYLVKDKATAQARS